MAAEIGAKPLLERGREPGTQRALDGGGQTGPRRVRQECSSLSLDCFVEPSLRLLSSRTVIRHIYVVHKP